jgi:hypothetical protein
LESYRVNTHTHTMMTYVRNFLVIIHASRNIAAHTHTAFGIVHDGLCGAISIQIAIF